jgi:hypothetical protein
MAIENKTDKKNLLISRDVTKYTSSDGYAEYEFGEIKIAHNPAVFAGIRLEQIDVDRNKKTFVKKLNLSHNQAKQLKKILRDLYPRD